MFFWVAVVVTNSILLLLLPIARLIYLLNFIARTNVHIKFTRIRDFNVIFNRLDRALKNLYILHHWTQNKKFFRKKSPQSLLYVRPHRPAWTLSPIWVVWYIVHLHRFLAKFSSLCTVNEHIYIKWAKTYALFLSFLKQIYFVFKFRFTPIFIYIYLRTYWYLILINISMRVHVFELGYITCICIFL